MRVCYTLVVAVAVLIARCELVSSTGQNKLAAADEGYTVKNSETAITSKRFLRTYDEEERIGIKIKRVTAPNSFTLTNNNIDDVLNIQRANQLLSSRRANKLLAKKKLGGWLGKWELNRVLNGNMEQKKKIFAKWRRNGRTAESVTDLIKKSDSSIEKKYRFVYVAYEGFQKSERKKPIIGNKRKRGET